MKENKTGEGNEIDHVFHSGEVVSMLQNDASGEKDCDHRMMSLNTMTVL